MEQDVRNVVTDDEIRERVALRAYELYQDRGGHHGRDIDDWLKAETEVLAEADQQKRLSARKQPFTTRSAETPRSARDLPPENWTSENVSSRV